ncbi:glucokinase [Pullulanibacillus pueri]|uniref:Glucokinase n=1 Tax=Pullulanibacillus pueri TaxID=1437324 RepID=A0A8J3A3C8_9BACL|nr:ROK family protein [Pullulanibacillus pueri]MBM7684222.1 glucokinase [Pullulanibacillus pueri]GGH89002.1 hypothetical protein GCM10007096_42610 [Pullulanibacillus pueri]
MTKCVVTLDIGGTSIHTAVVVDGIVQEKTMTTYPSLADRSKNIVIDHFTTIVNNQIQNFMESAHSAIPVLGVGIAFPGPSDYEKGVSYIKDLDKYESLYGVNLKEELYNSIVKDPFINRHISKDFSVYMENDATLFVLGEFKRKYKSKGVKKIAGFTLGTGIGSTFINDGLIVRGEYGIPKTGFIYNVPFKDATIDDYISKRGILKLASQHNLDSSQINVSDLANSARNGDNQAKVIFRDFGELLGEALYPFISSFEPEVIVFGGQISKSFKLFKYPFLQKLSLENIRVETSSSALYSTFIGADSLVI